MFALAAKWMSKFLCILLSAAHLTNTPHSGGWQSDIVPRASKRRSSIADTDGSSYRPWGECSVKVWITFSYLFLCLLSDDQLLIVDSSIKIGQNLGKAVG